MQSVGSFDLQFSELDYSFIAERTLANFNCAFSSASLNLLLGKNGVGKTTLLKIVAGLLIPEKGTLVCSLDPNISFARLKSWVFYKADRTPFYPEFSFQENLDFYARLYGKDRQSPLIEQAKHDFGLASFWDKPLQSLSRGTQEKLGLIYALVSNRPIKCFDEPFAFLDKASVELCLEYFLRWRRNGDLVIFSSHKLPDLAVDQTIELTGTTEASSASNLSLRALP